MCVLARWCFGGSKWSTINASLLRSSEGPTSGPSDVTSRILSAGVPSYCPVFHQKLHEDCRHFSHGRAHDEDRMMVHWWFQVVNHQRFNRWGNQNVQHLAPVTFRSATAEIPDTMSSDLNQNLHAGTRSSRFVSFIMADDWRIKKGMRDERQVSLFSMHSLEKLF